MEQEINNYALSKNWDYFELNSTPHDQILRSTWTFRAKLSRSSNMIIKLKSTFCGDG